MQGAQDLSSWSLLCLQQNKASEINKNSKKPWDFSDMV